MGGGGASAMSDLTDVDLTGVTDDSFLKYDATDDEWKIDNSITEKLVSDVNPTLEGTESAISSLEIGSTKYKVGGGHDMVSLGNDNGISEVEALQDGAGLKVANAYTMKCYSNTFKYKFVIEFEEVGNALGIPIDLTETPNPTAQDETTNGWVFSEDTQDIRDLFIGIDQRDDVNLDWRFDPNGQKSGLSVSRWQFDPVTGMMCFVFDQTVEVGTKFCIDLEILREYGV